MNKPTLAEEEAAQAAYAELFEWMETFTVPGPEGPVGRLTFQLNLYLRDAATPDVQRRVATVMDDYRTRFGEALNTVWTATEDGEFLSATSFDETGAVPAYDLMQRTQGGCLLVYTDAASETAGGHYECFFNGSALEEGLYGGAGLLQIALPPEAVGEAGGLTKYWTSIIETVQPTHGSGGYGLTVPAGEQEAHEVTRNQGLYRPFIERWPTVEINAHETDPGITTLTPEQGYREWIRTINWMTVLGPPLLTKIGGTEAIREATRIDPSISVSEAGEATIIKIDSFPLLGEREQAPTPGYGTVARLLKPIRSPVTIPAALDTMNFESEAAREQAWEAWRDRFDDL